MAFKRRTEFSSIPVELVVAFSKHLPIYSVACLSLTCKKLYNDQNLREIWVPHVKGRAAIERQNDEYTKQVRPDIRNHERLSFMLCLQVDLPQLLLCDYCLRFRPRQPSPRDSKDQIRFAPPYKDYLIPCSCSARRNGMMWLHYKEWSYHISFDHLQQLMLRNKCGGNHGPALTSLSLKSDWQLREYREQFRARWMKKMDVRPIFINSSLVLHICQRMLFNLSDLLAMKSDGISCSDYISVLIATCLKLCPCGSCTNISEISLWVRLQPGVELPSPGLSITSPLFKCNQCLTEVILNYFKHDEGDFELVVDTWTNLGSCAFSFSAAWLATASHSGIIYDSRCVTTARMLARQYSGYPSSMMTFFPSGTAINHASLRPKPTVPASVKGAIDKIGHLVNHQFSQKLPQKNIMRSCMYRLANSRNKKKNEATASKQNLLMEVAGDKETTEIPETKRKRRLFHFRPSRVAKA